MLEAELSSSIFKGKEFLVCLNNSRNVFKYNKSFCVPEYVETIGGVMGWKLINKSRAQKAPTPSNMSLIASLKKNM